MAAPNSPEVSMLSLHRSWIRIVPIPLRFMHKLGQSTITYEILFQFVETPRLKIVQLDLWVWLQLRYICHQVQLEGAAAWVLEKQGTAPKLVSCTGEHQPGEETTL